MASRPTRLAAGGSLLLGSVVTGTAVDLHSASAIGTTITVDSLADGPADPNHCFDPTVGNCTLRDAITVSNYLAGPDTITFDPALTGSIVLTSNLEYLSDGVVIEGPGADVLTVDGSNQYSGFVSDISMDPVTQQFPRVDLEIGGLTLRALSSATPPRFGAITIISGSLHAHDLVVTGSTMTQASEYLSSPVAVGLLGYSVGNLRSTSAVLERVTITDNHGAVGTGTNDASTAGSVILLAEDVELHDCTITDNSADRLAGPVLFGTSVEVTDSLIDGNISRLDFSGLVISAENTVVTGTVITNNSALTASGLFDYGEVLDPSGRSSHSVVRDSVIAHNHVLYGAVALFASTTAEIERVSIVDNVSDGIAPPPELSAPASNYDQSAIVVVRSDATLSSSTVADNVGVAISVENLADVGPAPTANSIGPSAASTRSSAPAAGLAHLLGRLHGPDRNAPATGPGAPATLRLAHSTVASNTRGGIIEHTTGDPLTASNVLLDHSIVSDNGGSTLAPDDLATPSTSRFSLIGRMSITPTEGFGGGNRFGAPADLEPLQWFSPLAALRPIGLRSAAWNTGDPEFVPPPTTDQRGEPRLVDIVDMGSFEVQERFVVPRFTG